jgi:hypothetical protein
LELRGNPFVSRKAAIVILFLICDWTVSPVTWWVRLMKAARVVVAGAFLFFLSTFLIARQELWNNAP